MGKTTFNGDGTMISETDTLMRIDVPEGQVPVKYRAVVHGKWFVEAQRLHTSRTSEEIVAKDEISRKFIESEGMKKLRSQSPSEFVRTLTISTLKILALDGDGSRTSYTRAKK